MSGRAHGRQPIVIDNLAEQLQLPIKTERSGKSASILEQVRSPLIFRKGASTYSKRSSTNVGVMRKVAICYPAHHPWNTIHDSVPPFHANGSG